MLKELIAKARYVNMTRPRVHGNGFLQLDLSETVRLHIWGHPDVPCQRIPTPIHDHRFSFSSIILRGRITNVEYVPITVPDGMEDTGTHWPYLAKVRDKENTILVPANVTRPTFFGPGARMTYHQGESYWMREGTTHETIPECLSVTVIAKIGRTLAQGGDHPYVYVPVGKKPDNDFNRYALPEDDCWKIIEESIR